MKVAVRPLLALTIVAIEFAWAYPWVLLLSGTFYGASAAPLLRPAAAFALLVLPSLMVRTVAARPWWLRNARALVAAAGVLFLLKQRVRYPTRFEAVDELTSLLERLDASPVAGIGVNVKGQIIGRGFPGYVLSPDLVVQDKTGFVPLLYRQPLPFWASLFALFRADAFMGQEVIARGWYRRLPGPGIELREVQAADGRRTRAWSWMARYVASAVVVLAGLIVMAVGLAGV